MSATTVLLVDDNPTNLKVLQATLAGRDFRLLAAKNGEAALRIARKTQPSLVLLDIMMPGIDGYETCRQLKSDPRTSAATVIFLSALGETADKVEGFDVGAVDYITKPFESAEVVARVETHLEIHRLKAQLEARNRDLERELGVARELIREAARREEGVLLGESAAIKSLRQSIDNQAMLSTPALLIAAPGAGAEAVARSIHARSPRAARPLLVVNGALPLGEGEAETLFSKPGSPWHLAAGGTLLVEFVADLPQEAQRDLARLLEGETKSVEAAPRIIATAGLDLESRLSQGLLAPELYEKLNRHRVQVPSLAERMDDLPALIEHAIAEQARRLQRPLKGVTAGSLQRARRYHWPGNVRELRSLIERLAMNSEGTLIDIPEHQLQHGGPVGSYRLIKKLGEGGMGEVWRAEHQLLARPAAIKLVRSDLLGEEPEERERHIARFEKEARSTALLCSPHTVTLYDYGVTEKGALYYVMELLDGLDLSELIESYGAISPGRALRILSQACLSLHEAHEAGLIHRDLKPANLFLCRMGAQLDFVKVLDFGLIKGDIGRQDRNLTKENFLVGTPGFMAPEYIAGTALDARSDLYSLACVGFYLITGDFLFEGETTMQIMMKHATKDAPRLSEKARIDITEPVDELFAACLSRKPGDRPSSALVLSQMLDEVARDCPWTDESCRGWWNIHKPPKPQIDPFEIADGDATTRDLGITRYDQMLPEA